MKSFLLSLSMLFLAAQNLSAALTFSVTSSNLIAGASSFDTEIRVSGGVPGDSLQYFALSATVSMLTGGKTLNIANLTTLDSLNSPAVRTSSDYVFNDRGLAVTGVAGAGKATFVSNVLSTSAEFRDGVAIPVVNDSSSNPIPNTAIAFGANKSVAKLRFTLTSGTFSAGDSFQVSLQKLSSTTSAFASSTLGTSPLSFTGAATNYNGTTGLDLNNSLVLTPGVFSITAVLEPSSILLIGITAGGLGVRKLRRRWLNKR